MSPERMISDEDCLPKFMPQPANLGVVSDSQFRAEFERRFPSLSFEFIAGMDEIGKLGRDKWGDNAIEIRVKRGDYSRNNHRLYARMIADHAATHFSQYLDGIRHDVYGTRKHQLFAAAFNPMMEFLLSEGGK